MVNIGFLGGSFDPVHLAHLCAAQDALEQLSLDKVVLLPAAQAPLKRGCPRTSDEHRLAMLRLALEDFPAFEVSDHEIRRGGVSYTIDTVRHFRLVHPHDRLFWILGADQLAQLPLWHRVDELVRLTEFICLERPGHPVPTAPAIAGLRLHRCPGHQLEISSTDIRRRAGEGKSLHCLMPHKAVVYLQENRLYR